MNKVLIVLVCVCVSLAIMIPFTFRQEQVLDELDVIVDNHIHDSEYISFFHGMINNDTIK